MDIYNLSKVQLGANLVGPTPPVSGVATTRLTGTRGIDLRAVTDAITADRYPTHLGICICTQVAIAEGTDTPQTSSRPRAA